MIPYNHPTYQFPYNLEDRADFIKKNIKELNSKIDIDIKKIKKNDDIFELLLTIKENEKTKNYENDINKIIEKYNGKKEKNNWIVRLY
jgi:3-dehydroquinate dehydratase